MKTETLSREWLQLQISAIEGAGITDSNTLAAFKLALAAMSSKPVVADEVEHVAAVLELIGSFEATDIDSDTVDLRFEIADVDTGSDVSITEYAARGSAIIRMLTGISSELPDGYVLEALKNTQTENERHCCKVSDEAAFCLIQRPYISKTLLTRRISPRGSP
ncbi:hypothetical protein [Klebsiella pneumoniae]|uniref:hypothetical protein n=1 Tax=Klebsiella pneumoniae TaxID=573 RepID=UPI0022467135|nr:hypothetical protein [Klebsiella pneumoniae]MCW9210921.1 hypothetical protein [Klebsiella pneumoniae]